MTNRFEQLRRIPMRGSACACVGAAGLATPGDAKPNRAHVLDSVQDDAGGEGSVR